MGHFLTSVFSLPPKEFYHCRKFFVEIFSESLVGENKNQEVAHRGEVAEQNLKQEKIYLGLTTFGTNNFQMQYVKKLLLAFMKLLCMID